MRGIEDFLSRPFIWLAKKFSQNQETHKSNQIENDLLGLVVVMSVVDWWKSARTRDATVFLRPVCGGFLSGLAEKPAVDDVREQIHASGCTSRPHLSHAKFTVCSQGIRLRNVCIRH